MKYKLKIIKLYKKFQPFMAKGLILLVLSLVVFAVAEAASRSAYYNPGETLDPSCAPGDTNCSVYPALNIAISKTYAELSSMATAGTLVKGQKYRITDFRTKHLIPNTAVYNTGPTEVLVVEALTASTLKSEAKSESYPQDIIHYELVQSHYWNGVLIDGGDRGWIYYREDTLQNNKVDYDFRNVKWRRWNTQADGLGTWTVLTDNTFPSQDFLTFQNYALTNGNDFNIAGKSNESNPGQNYNNIFFGYCAGNTSKGLFHDNTFLGEAAHNSFGILFNSNILAGGFTYNQIKDNFYNNITQGAFDDNTLDLDFVGYTFPAGTVYGSFIGGFPSTHPALKLWQDSLIDVPQEGGIEYITGGSNFYGTDATGIRKTFAWLESPAFTTPNIGDAAGTSLSVSGDIKNNTAGGGIYIKEGVNATMGVATLVGGTVTVNTTKVTANSRIFLTTQTLGGTIGIQYISARVAGTSFTITSTSGTDTSVIAWHIVEPS